MMRSSNGLLPVVRLISLEIAWRITKLLWIWGMLHVQCIAQSLLQWGYISPISSHAKSLEILMFPKPRITGPLWEESTGFPGHECVFMAWLQRQAIWLSGGMCKETVKQSELLITGGIHRQQRHFVDTWKCILIWDKSNVNFIKEDGIYMLTWHHEF